MVQEDAPYLRRLMWLRYEDLTRDPIASLTGVTEFLELDSFRPSYLPDSIRVHERDGAVADLNAESLSRLSDSGIRIVNSIAAHQLQEFGYEIGE